MAAVTREELHTMIDGLPAERLQAAQAALDRLSTRLVEDRAALRATLAESLREDGLIAHVPPPMSAADRARMRNRPLIKLEGETIAETVVKNREPVA